MYLPPNTAILSHLAVMFNPLRHLNLVDLNPHKLFQWLKYFVSLPLCIDEASFTMSDKKNSPNSCKVPLALLHAGSRSYSHFLKQTFKIKKILFAKKVNKTLLTFF